MRGPQGGALDNRMSLMLGMDNDRADRLRLRKNSKEAPVAHGDGTGMESLADSRRKGASHASRLDDASQVSQGDDGGEAIGNGNSSTYSRSEPGARPAEMGDAPAGNEIIMISNGDVPTSAEGESEPADEEV